MKLIVGLGNPGNKYQLTRHNAGFLAIDYFIEKEKGDYRELFNSLIYKTKNYILVKPQLFMNLSGEAVAAIANFYKIDNADIIVIADDVDLPLGKLRLQIGGGSAGHNGIKNIIALIGNDFKRLRIGIGKEPGWQTADYVLANFTQEQLTQLTPVLATTSNIIKDFLTMSFEQLMNQYNRR